MTSTSVPVVIDTTTDIFDRQSGQTYSSTRILQFGTPGHQSCTNLRLTVHHDSTYPGQSRNRVEVLRPSVGWSEVAVILGEDARSRAMATGYGSPTVARLTASVDTMFAELTGIARRTLGI